MQHAFLLSNLLKTEERLTSHMNKSRRQLEAADAQQARGNYFTILMSVLHTKMSLYFVSMMAS